MVSIDVGKKVAKEKQIVELVDASKYGILNFNPSYCQRPMAMCK